MRRDDTRFRRTPLWRPGLGEGVDEELRHHVEERIDRLIDEGWEPEEARREAERRIGDLRRIRGEVLAEAGAREGRKWMADGIDGWMQDVRLALRGIRRSPGFALSLVTTLALGIGATGGVFSVLDAVMLRPLPYDAPEELVEVKAQRGSLTRPFSLSQVDDWVEGGAELFAGLEYHEDVSLLRTDRGHGERLRALAATPGLSDFIGLELAFGRMFSEEQARVGAQVAVLTWPYWNGTGADPDIVGTEIRIDDRVTTVIGVLARGEKYPVAGTIHLWVPLEPGYTAVGRELRQVSVLGRVPEGRLEATRAAVERLSARLETERPNPAGWVVELSPIVEWRANPDTMRGLWMLGGAAVLMLLIAALNATNLLLVRGTEREAEVSVRKALGASRGRVARHAIVESVVLALLSGVAATALAALSVEGVAAIAPSEVTFGMVHEFGLEPRALGVIFLVATGAGIAIGLLPGLRLAMVRVSGSGAARERGRDRAGRRLRGALVGVEIAVSVVLLAGAGLFLRSFANVLATDLGVDVDRVAFLEVSLPESGYPDGAARAEFADRLRARLAGVPGVERIALANGGPPGGAGIYFGEALAGEGEDPIEGISVVASVIAGEGYLEALGARMRSGRTLEPGDGAFRRVLVDADLAETLFGPDEPVGRRFSFNVRAEDPTWYTVVGVVDELALGGPNAREGNGAMIEAMNPAAPPSWLAVVLRAGDDPAGLLEPVREIVRSEDPRLPIEELWTAEEALADALLRPRFIVSLLTVLAGLALALSAVGIFGVVSYAVRQSRRELGIRVALGAPLARVRGEVVGRGVLWGVIGTGAGLAAALRLDDLAADLLYQIEPGDLPTMIGVALAMLGVTVLACLIPAHRATRVDPADVLRAE